MTSPTTPSRTTGRACTSPAPRPPFRSDSAPTHNNIFLHLVPFAAPSPSAPHSLRPSPLPRPSPVLLSFPFHSPPHPPPPNLYSSSSPSSPPILQPHLTLLPPPLPIPTYHHHHHLPNYPLQLDRLSLPAFSPPTSSLLMKMTTYAPNTNTLPSAPHKPRDKRHPDAAAAAAAAAAAEREVIEDTDAWNDVSDDEEFSKRPSNLLSRQLPLQSQQTSPSLPQHLISTPPLSSPTKPNQAPIVLGSRLSLSNTPTLQISQQVSRNSPSINNPQSHFSSVAPSSLELPDHAPSSSHILSPNSNLSASLIQTLPQPTTTTTTTFPIRQDYAELIRDPAHVLKQQQVDSEDIPQPSASSRPDAPLPWDAVIPAELMSPPAYHQHHLPVPSSGPSGPGPDQPSDSKIHQRQQPSLPPTSPIATTFTTTTGNLDETNQKQRKEAKFLKCLSQPSVDVVELRKLSWSGIPNPYRSMAWQILLGYLPTPSERRVEVLKRKRKEYGEAVRLAFGKGKDGLDLSIWHQIEIDVLRTNSSVPIWQFQATQRSLERILYVWAIRHPASGYVQGINDLVTSFFQVFVSVYVEVSLIENIESLDVGLLPLEVLEAVEADSFWCLSKLLDGIQDNYIFAQPGIQRSVARMKELTKRVDARLHQHLEDEKVEFIQFAFRWINCLLMRELSTRKIIRMWDTYLAEGTNAFSEFHLYVCVAFLVKYSDQLRSMDFQSIIIFLQALPTEDWSEKDLELVLSQAFMWYSLFQGAIGHFERR